MPVVTVTITVTITGLVRTRLHSAPAGAAAVWGLVLPAEPPTPRQHRLDP